jgi:hypothetical protein
VQLYSKSFTLSRYVLPELHSTLEFHNYFIQCQIFCGVVQCGICVTWVVESSSDLPQPVRIRILSVSWIFIIFEVTHFRYMHKPIILHDLWVQWSTVQLAD